MNRLSVTGYRLWENKIFIFVYCRRLVVYRLGGEVTAGSRP